MPTTTVEDTTAALDSTTVFETTSSKTLNFLHVFFLHNLECTTSHEYNSRKTTIDKKFPSRNEIKFCFDIHCFDCLHVYVKCTWMCALCWLFGC